MKGGARHECNLLFTCKNDVLRMLLEQNTNELYYRERWITSYIIHTSMLQVVRHLMSSKQVGLKVCHLTRQSMLCNVDWREFGGGGVGGVGTTSQPHCPELTSLWTIYTPTPLQWYSYSDGGRTSCFFHLRQHYGVRPLNQNCSVHLLQEKWLSQFNERA
jgi:hypothetical protein